MTVQIPLTKGYIAIVDDCDADLAQYKWYAHVGRNGSVYPLRSIFASDGKRRSISMSRVVLSRVLRRSIEPGEFVDNICGDGTVNTRANLRLASREQTSRNRKTRHDNASGYKGVSYRPKLQSEKKYVAGIVFKRHYYYLGLFMTAEEAHDAYCKAADELHGEFANFGATPEQAHPTPTPASKETA